jgi:uncharacterized repeat protein (TIGR01451 family)
LTKRSINDSIAYQNKIQPRGWILMFNKQFYIIKFKTMNYLVKAKNLVGSNARKQFAAVAVVALVFSVFVPTTQANHGGPYGDVEMKKIILCHDESGDGTDYHSSGGVSVSAAISGHGSHETDIIPPFHYKDGSYAGLNWNADNEEIWDGGNCGEEVPPATALLTLVKTVTNDDGGTALPTAWTLNADGTTTDISGATGSAAVTNAVVTPGVYTLSETNGPAGYTAGQWQCTGATPVISTTTTVNVAVDADVTCTINNNDNDVVVIPDTGTLRVIKTIINDNGGIASTPAHFSFQVNGGSAVTFEVDGQNDMVVNVGAYTVVETAAAGYTTSYTNCTSVSVVKDQVTTCTITNDDIDNSLPQVDLGLTKTVDQSEVAAAGDQVTFTVTVTNPEALGGNTAHGVVVTDLLPSNFEYVSATPDADYDEVTGIWTVGELAPQASEVLTITVKVNGADTNHACITTLVRTTDPVSTNDCADSSVTIRTSGGGGGSSGGGGSRRTPRVLGDSDVTSIRMPEGRVLGATELPRTGAPMEVLALFAFMALVAAFPVLDRKASSK